MAKARTWYNHNVKYKNRLKCADKVCLVTFDTPTLIIFGFENIAAEHTTAMDPLEANGIDTDLFGSIARCYEKFEDLKKDDEFLGNVGEQKLIVLTDGGHNVRDNGDKSRMNHFWDLFK
ncbi:unnamed protein product [Didymodactylos carnosus]|uniref:Uncharacterized protein n=1 Tax=Didymodactylos carnosus TaxID=1234261 RepID=A0A815JV06_9BILA|nr:unnamed protein product [Didymodactylos carnosus]CAF4279026.1 unnamed protein product [Didymodactylos carnosus]